jgi:prevent-host-death family protein
LPAGRRLITTEDVWIEVDAARPHHRAELRIHDDLLEDVIPVANRGERAADRDHGTEVDLARATDLARVVVARKVEHMTLHSDDLKSEVGVRELHDHLSRYVQHVQSGAEVMVTMRGRRVAKLVPVDETGALADLRARGLIREPATQHGRRRSPLPTTAPVSDLVAEQRR